MQNRNLWIYLALVFSLAAYIVLAYFTPREQFSQMVVVFSVLFAAYALINKTISTNKQLYICLGASILFRLLWLPAIPDLSDDYFRFIWDGRLLVHGWNPYLILPSQLYNTPEALQAGLTENLYGGLNSPHYYTVYPPVLQAVFGLSALLFPDDITGSIAVMRIVIILAEIGALLLLGKFLQQMHLPRKRILLYALNPLVISELTGNLHFEAVMLFWLLLGIWLLVRGKWALSAVCWSLAIGTKLIPLLFLPFIIKRLGWVRSSVFFALTGSLFLLQFLPFLSRELVGNFFSSVDLYFQKFEFNASIYYIVRWIGYQVHGYNIIGIAGPVLSFMVFILILRLAYREREISVRSLFLQMLWSLSLYYLLATTVHPWYITTLVGVSLFTRFRYPVLWSGLLILSYATYQNTHYQENLWLTTLEYGVLFGYMVYELRNIDKQIGSHFMVSTRSSSL